MSNLRIYKNNTPQYELYKQMHEKQTLDYVMKKKLQYSKLNNAKMNIKEVLLKMDNFIDPSDPDIDVPNSIHAYQTAERIRKKYPQDKEYQIIGLIHDLGKILFEFGEENWSVVGDTYVAGCEYPKSIVYYETLKRSPDFNKYTKNGIYEIGCDIIRYHSFYPWHTGNDYYHFMNEKDKNILKNIKEFNSFDLYSKEDPIEITKETKEYYNKLLDEYFNGELNW